MKKTKYLILGLVAVAFTSCDITDSNINPDSASDALVSANLRYPAIVAQTHRNMVAVNGRIAGIVIQQWEGLDAQQVAYTNYNIGEDDVDALWDGGLYAGGAMTNCFTVIESATPEQRAIAKIYMAANLGLGTSMWGDMPYSEAFRGDQGIERPSYDSQEAIYTSIQTLLDESIADGVASGFGAFQVDADWVATAHSLKARYYMHLTKRDPAAATKALAEIAQGLTSTADQPDFFYAGTTQFGNPIALFENDRPATLGFGSRINSLMTGDPRLPLYTTNGNSFSGPTLFWGQSTSPTPLISFWEVKFLQAEALARTNATDAAVLLALREAVRANMLYVGVSAADATAYTATLTLPVALNDKIGVIIREKYKALYGNAPAEAWVDFRRTGFPALTPSPSAVLGNNPSGIVPRRFLYPQSERTTNNVNYSAAIAAQGGHLLDVDLWAFRN